jgi:hypothetical protein
MAPKTAEKNEKNETKGESGKAAERRNLDLALQSIVKTYGENAIMRLGDAGAKLKIEVIPQGVSLSTRRWGREASPGEESWRFLVRNRRGRPR